MIRRRHGRSLFREQGTAEEDVNPNSYLTNLADCMLVMVVGLLVALVTHYNVDLQATQDEIDETTGAEVAMDADGDGQIDPNYEDTGGKVYRDSKTGKYYLVTEAGK